MVSNIWEDGVLMVMMVTSHNPYWNNSIASCENKIELEPELHHYVLMSTVILNIILRNVLRHVNPWLIHVNVWQKTTTIL